MGPNFPFLASKWHLIASKYPKLAKEKLVQTVNILHLYRSLKHQSDHFLPLQKIVTFTEQSKTIISLLKPVTWKWQFSARKTMKTLEPIFSNQSCAIYLTTLSQNTAENTSLQKHKRLQTKMWTISDTIFWMHHTPHHRFLRYRCTYSISKHFSVVKKTELQLSLILTVVV